MFKGTINYRAASARVAFETMELDSGVQNAGSATLTASAEEITLKVEITGAASTAEALLAGARAADHVAKVLTYKLGRPIREFGVVEHALVEEQDDATPIHHLGHTLGISQKVDDCNYLGDRSTTEIKEFLDKKHHAGYMYYEQFRAALLLSDPLAQFMSLYNIILSLSGDSQEEVDKLALQIDSSTPTNPPYRPRKSGTLETVYTRLRNQIGHVRPGTTIEATRAEMETWKDRLIRLAKVLIDRQP